LQGKISEGGTTFRAIFLLQAWEHRAILTERARLGLGQETILFAVAHFEDMLSTKIKNRIQFILKCVELDNLSHRVKSSSIPRDQFDMQVVGKTIKALLANNLRNVEIAPLIKLVELHDQVFETKFSSLLTKNENAIFKVLPDLRNTIAHGRPTYFAFEEKIDGEFSQNFDDGSLSRVWQLLARLDQLPTNQISFVDAKTKSRFLWEENSVRFFFEAIREMYWKIVDANFFAGDEFGPSSGTYVFPDFFKLHQKN
jgi:hypothetical protein